MYLHQEGDTQMMNYDNVLSEPALLDLAHTSANYGFFNRNYLCSTVQHCQKIHNLLMHGVS
jgi:hypothetical protein